MKGIPQQVVKFGVTVWQNPMMDALRKEECLCLNCARLKPLQPDNCHIAQALYEICVRENTAFAVTRCPIWQPKQKP